MPLQLCQKITDIFFFCNYISIKPRTKSTDTFFCFSEHVSIMILRPLSCKHITLLLACQAIAFSGRQLIVSVKSLRGSDATHRMHVARVCVVDCAVRFYFFFFFVQRHYHLQRCGTTFFFIWLIWIAWSFLVFQKIVTVLFSNKYTSIFTKYIW